MDKPTASLLRIGVNLIYLRPAAVGGSEVYAREMVRHLRALPDVELVLYCNAESRPTFADGDDVAVVEALSRPFSQWGRLSAENWALRRHLARRPVDVLWSPANFAAPLLPRRPAQVATVHDLQHLWFPENFSRTTRLSRSLLFRLTFARAGRLIAISEFTRRDLLARYGLAAERVTTVLEGVDRSAAPVTSAAREAARRRFDLRHPFFFYPAMTAPHKNHTMLIEAFAEVHRASARPVELVLSGQRTPEFAALMRRAAELGVGSSVRHVGFLGREDLFAVLSLATALVFPSRFEGFGLPPLEAMACGTPVIAAAAASIPEVVGPAALLISPDERAAWVNAMDRVGSDETLREELISAGYTNLERFSWERAALQTVEVLRRAARQG